MKSRILVLAAAAVVLSTAAAQAGLVVVGTRINNVGTITATGAGNGAYDEIDFHLTAFTGLDATDPTRGGQFATGVAALGGTFSAGGSYITTGGGYTNGDPLGNGTAEKVYPSSFVNFDTALPGTVKTGVVGGTGASSRGTAVYGNFGTLNGDARLRPDDQDTSDTLDQTLVAKIFVQHNAGVSFVGTYGSGAQDSAVVTFGINAVTAGPTLTLGAAAAPVTVPGNNLSYTRTAIGGNGSSYVLGGSEGATGHTLVGFDFSGGTTYSNFFSGGLPAGATQVTDPTLLAADLALFNQLGGSYDVVIDLGTGVPTGSLTAGSLPGGVTLNQIAVVPEPTSLAGLALLGVPSLTARRRSRR